MKPILVTSYVNPDLDATAGVIAYAEFLQKSGKPAVAGIIGEPHDEARYLLDRFAFEYPKEFSSANDFDEVILVDASDLSGLEGKIVPERVAEIIDHRKVNEAEKFVNAKVQIELVGAAATLIAEKFMHANVEISMQSATLLYGAIISNTLNFKGSHTTERDQKAANWLNRTAQLPANFWAELFIAKSNLSGDRLTKRIESDSAWFEFGGEKFGIAQIEMIGAKKLISQRGHEIVKELAALSSVRHLRFMFLNLVELDEQNSFFVTDNTQAQKLLEKVFNLHFNRFVALYPKMILRKQIVPRLKEELER